MPPRSLHDQHPREADQLAALLRQLREASGISQKELARGLSVSESALSRYLDVGNKEVLPEPSLKPFLEQTGASAEHQEQARTLMDILTGDIQPPTAPPAPAQLTASMNILREQREHRISQTANRGPLARALRKLPVVAAAVILPCLLVAGSADGRVEVLPASSSAWSAPLPDGRSGVYGHAVFYRQAAWIVLFDDYEDGRASIADVKINGRRIEPQYNSNGKTDSSHPPHIVDLTAEGFKPTDTLEYRVCAGQTKYRGRPLKRCGDPVVDSGAKQVTR